MAEYDGDNAQERGIQQHQQTSVERRGNLQYYGDPGWHLGRDAYGNPVWYRAYGWSWQSPGFPSRREEEEPHSHGRTRSRHYQRSDERIREDIYDRLNDHQNIDSSDIRVGVSGGEVTLEGTVHARREKRLAEDVAESVSGVRDVQNRLKVANPTEAANNSQPEMQASSDEKRQQSTAAA
jgi:hypothetical protein